MDEDRSVPHVGMLISYQFYIFFNYRHVTGFVRDEDLRTDILI